MSAFKTILEIDLNRYRNNIKTIVRSLPPQTQLMAVVKASAYGLGTMPIATAAIESGARFLGVSQLSEATELRLNGIKVPILLLSEVHETAINKIAGLDLTATVYHLNYAKMLNAMAGRMNKKIRIHIKVDTGMGRLGLKPIDVPLFFKGLSACPNLIIEGIYTHFAKADDRNSHYTQQQYSLFMQVIDDLHTQGIAIPIMHAANSDAYMHFPDMRLNMVRIGLISYQNIFTLKSTVSQCRTQSAGSAISYGCTAVVPKDTYIATVASGYADGVPIQLSNKGRVLINGKSYPIIGRVCMDMFMVDVGPDTVVHAGDPVVIIGAQHNETISLNEICQLTGLIPYEIMCNFGKRVLRNYLD